VGKLFDTSEAATARGRAMGSHHSAAAMSDTWLTPRHILDALGPFDLDPCAAPDPILWPTAARHIVWPSDGLAAAWAGRVWLNPPYGAALGAWLAKLAEHGEGTAIAFARTETAAFFAQVWERAAGLLFLRGRLHFHHADGRRAEANAGAPSVLIAYGARDAERLFCSGLDGAPVALNRPTLLWLATVPDQPCAAWRDIVRDALAGLGGAGTLAQLYDALDGHPKAEGKANWRAKVRQTVARMKLPKVAAGTYALAAA